ncbi:MAG: hypothetical protein NZ893_01675 [Candidatus Aenigmarchaeota archaeon]|nr:hypothetical protein [Candidatus Aenigmarchaeota archaeon]
MKQDFVETNDGVAKFQLILWSRDSDYTIFLKESEIPTDVKIEIYPRILKKGEEDVFVAVGNEFIRAHNVVIVANTTKYGNYTFKISALAYKDGNVIQEREFRLMFSFNAYQINASSYITGDNKNFAGEVKIERLKQKHIFIIIIIITLTLIILLILLRK